MGLALLLLVASVALKAQPVDTVLVKLTDTVPTYSHYWHWQDAVYRWTVDGGGKVGQFGGKNKVDVDARFALTNFTFGSLNVSNPKLPVDDNGGLYVAFCALQPQVCNTFFATNAVDKPGSPQEKILDNFALNRNAALMKHFRFIPDNDSYNPQHIYTRTVTGSNRFGQFMFIDRYGETGYEAYYADNSDNNQPTTLRVIAERKSPELILTAVHDSTLILNDEDRSMVLLSKDVSLGTLSLQAVSGGAALITQQVFRNRGLDKLQIHRLEITGDVTDFSVVDLDKNNNTPSYPLSLDRYLESSDALRVEVRFQPKTVGSKILVIHLYCNDTTQNADGAWRYFELVVRGTGTDARLSMPDVIDFGSRPVGGGPFTEKLVIKSIGTSAAQFGYTLPNSPFSLVKEGGATEPDPVLNLTTGNEVRSDVKFDPQVPGDFLDSIIIGNGNTQRYVVYLKGRGELASVALAADTLDLAQDTIFFGITREGVPIRKSFYVRNTGNVKLSIKEPLIPHYSVTNSYAGPPDPLKDNDKLEFNPEFVFSENNIDTVENWQAFLMRFDARALPFRSGLIEAKLTVSVTIPDNSLPEGYRVVGSASFILSARKLQARPNAVDNVEFDSVYVNNPCPDNKVVWSVTNEIEKAVVLTGQRMVIIHSSSGSAFSLSGLTYEKTLEPNETVGPVLEYKPTRRGPDTTRFYMRYRSGTEEDSIDVLVRGVGVEQEMRLDSAIQDLSTEYYTFPGDTINLGNVRVGEQSSVTAYFSNKGNLPFRMRPNGQILKESIFPENGYNFSSVLSPFPDVTVPIGSTAKTTIRVAPTKAGTHLLRCEIASDIIAPERGIKCVPAEAAARVFFVRFNGIKPVVQADKNELDFGSVIRVQECQQSKIIPVRVTNAGNTDMEVQIPVMEKGAPFDIVNPQSFTVPAGGSATVEVRFTPSGLGTFDDALLLKSDAGTPDTTLRIPVRGEAVSPQLIGIKLPVLTARPGRRIAIPIIVDKPALLTSVSSFSTTLLYDHSLLVYSRTFSVKGTAAQSAAASDVVVDDSSPGALNVSITLPANTFFQDKDTLLVLYFDTYLGQERLTSINFRSSDFGVGNCKGLLSIATEGGAFALDSVCNLGSLIGPPASGMFRLEQNTPNPAGDGATVEYEVAFATTVKVAVYNTRGEHVANIADGWHYAGTYRVPIPVHSLAPGLYFYEMRAGIFREAKKMYIAK